jgi:hypothetical protein
VRVLRSDTVKYLPYTANYLPPPHDLALPIVRLMNHPHYQTYQAHIAALSLVPNLCIKYIPPAWNALPPPTPLPGATVSGEAEDKQQRNEWKRRIMMYRELKRFHLVPPLM